MTRATLTLVAVAVLAAVAWWLVDDEAPRDDVAIVDRPEVATSTPGATPDDAAADALDETPRELASTDATAATEAARDAVHIAGRVVTEFGAAIPGAELLLVPDGATLARDAPDFHAMSPARRLVRPDPGAPPWTSFARTTSDALGRFAFDVGAFAPAWRALALGGNEDLPLLVVRAEGFASRHVPVEASAVDEGLEVTLAPAVRVEGRVTWTDGASAAGLDVEVLPHWRDVFDVTRRWFLRPWRTTRTDGDGRYAIDGLPAARLDVVVARGAVALSRTTADATRAAEVTHDVVLERGPRLDVTVTGDGRALEDAEVFALVPDAARPARAPSARVVLGRTEPMLRVNDDPEAELQLGAARTGSRGVASVDLPAGTTACALLVTAPEHLGAFEPRVVLDGDVTRHELDLTGETLDVVEILASSTGEPTDVELTATLVESARYGVDSALDVRRIDVGRFELTGRGDDDVELTLSAPGSADQHAAIAGTSRSHTVEWTPTPPAVVRGRVVGDDGDVLPGARVYLSPTGPASTRAGRREIETDDRGRFELSSRPGPHRLSALADGHDLTRLELDLAAGDLDLGDVVLASVGRLVIVDHQRGPPRSVSIARDVGADGDEEWKGFWYMILTAQGRGVVERVPAGRYRVEREGYPTKVVEVVADETTTVEYATEEPVRLVATLAAPTDESFTLEARVTDGQIGPGRTLLAPTPFTDRLDVTVPHAPRIELGLRDAGGALVLTETLDDVVPGSVQTTVLEPGAGTLTLALDASTANCVVTPVLDGTPRGSFRADREAGTRVSLGYVPVGVIDVEVHACGVVEALTIDTTRVSTLTVRLLDGLPMTIEVVAE